MNTSNFRFIYPRVCCKQFITRSFHLSKQLRNRLVLGIETSCDDTGAAIVDEKGTILGEALHSQHDIHLRNGGIIPPIARDLHARYIKDVVHQAVTQSGVSLQDISAIATTVKPGLILSLEVGLNYSKQLVKESGKPFIPIHHMEAHALTVRMVEKVEYPFLAFLASGGHCQLALVKNVEEFLLLGSSIDGGVGEALDKTARRLKLSNLPDCSKMNGGQAIEYVALKGDPRAFSFPAIMTRQRDCNFSFSGLKFTSVRIILEEEKKYGIEADGVLPNVADVCASYQLAITKHLVKRLQRALVFCDIKNLLPEGKKTVVLSGGVASNNYIRTAFTHLCNSMDYQFLCPPPKLCTDNGIMIAWNGIEKLKANTGIAADPENIQVVSKCALGTDISTNVTEADIHTPRFKIPTVSENPDQCKIQSAR